MSLSSHEEPASPAAERRPADSAAPRWWKLKAIAIASGLVLAACASWLGFLTIQVKRQSVRDEAQAADVIVVLGAAAYRGRPSPILKARLDHGLNLYRRQLAPRILTTGGAGGDPDYTESETGRAYLMSRGVPSEAVILEPVGDSTVYSTAAAGEIMHRMDLHSCIVVSDGYHIFRAKKLLEDRGLTVYGSPRPQPERNDWDYWKLCLRQAGGYALWRVGLRI
jgi:uncharacterized SAM-binding protein YcdF (DUF218 family)